jgi:hypothetical protein
MDVYYVGIYIPCILVSLLTSGDLAYYLCHICCLIQFVRCINRVLSCGLYCAPEPQKVVSCALAAGYCICRGVWSKLKRIRWETGKWELRR